MKEIIICSDSEHDKVYAEIYYSKKFVAIVSQEKGVHNLEIEFPNTDVDQEMVTRSIPFDKFMELLRMAASELTK